jgi:hypothetical protein
MFLQIQPTQKLGPVLPQHPHLTRTMNDQLYSKLNFCGPWSSPSFFRWEPFFKHLWVRYPTSTNILKIASRSRFISEGLHNALIMLLPVLCLFTVIAYPSQVDCSLYTYLFLGRYRVSVISFCDLEIVPFIQCFPVSRGAGGIYLALDSERARIKVRIRVFISTYLRIRIHP